MCDARLTSQTHWTGVSNTHHFNAHSRDAHTPCLLLFPQHHFICLSHQFYFAFTPRRFSDKELHLTALFDVFAAENHKTLSERACTSALGKQNTQKGKVHSASRKRGKAHTRGFGGLDASPTATGYESEDANTEDSMKNHESEARHNVSPKIW